MEREETEGTRHYARFNIHHPSLMQFQKFLTGLDGGGRSEKTAGEMAVDISKFLRYAWPDGHTTQLGSSR